MRVSKSFWLWGQFSDPDVRYLSFLRTEVQSILTSPYFLHHITLAGPYQFIDESFSKKIEYFSKGNRNIKLYLKRYSFNNEMFKSFFIEVGNSKELHNLRNNIYLISPFDKVKKYEPHISLAYGIHKKHEKIELISKLPELRDSVIISKISIVDVDESINSWKILKSFNLK